MLPPAGMAQRTASRWFLQRFPTMPVRSMARGTSVAAYGGTGWIATSAPGPADRGVNLFVGGSQSTMYQELDVSPAATLIDSGKVTYEVSAWLGAGAPGGSPTVTYMFFDWSGKQLAPTANLGPL